MTSASAAAVADRIAAALGDETPSDAIATLIAEAEHARKKTESDQKVSHARALDPTLDAEAAGRAKREADGLGFEAERLATALQALQNAHAEAKAREKDARRRAAYDEAKMERDALVEELGETYPELERRLADLISRLAANDAVLERVNEALPLSGAWLAGAEEIARGGVENFGGRQGYLALRITNLLRLPRFEPAPLKPYAWPSP